MKTFAATALLALGIISISTPASADWLLTGYVAPLFNVKTAESSVALNGRTFDLPAEKFDDSVGFGVSLASAFPTRGNLGFELDLGWNPKALETSDQFGTLFASRLLTISTNFFYSPSVPRIRPYLTIGPNFGYRSDSDASSFTTPSGWAVGVNGGGGIIAFATQRFGGRVDVRYYRNFGSFYDLREDATDRNSGWTDLKYLRVFVGVTAAL